MKRIRFYHWLRYDVLNDEPATYPSGISKIIYAILFPLDYLYQRQSRIKYFPETNSFLINGHKIRGKAFYAMGNQDIKSIVLKKDPSGYWDLIEGIV